MPKPFPAEFRRDVIAVARKGEASIAQVARDFGVSESCLQRWLKIADREEGLAPPAASGDRGGGIKDEAAELRELRRRKQAAGAGERDPAPGDGLLRPRRAPKMIYPLVRELAAEKRTHAVRSAAAVTCRRARSQKVCGSLSAHSSSSRRRSRAASVPDTVASWLAGPGVVHLPGGRLR